MSSSLSLSVEEGVFLVAVMLLLVLSCSTTSLVVLAASAAGVMGVVMMEGEDDDVMIPFFRLQGGYCGAFDERPNKRTNRRKQMLGDRSRR